MTLKYNLKKLDTSTTICFNPITFYEDVDDIKTILEDENSYTVIENEKYNSLSKYIYRMITKVEFLCKGLNETYILEAFERADAIIIIGTNGLPILPNGNIFSFAIVKFNDYDNSIYLDVICSHIGIKYAGEKLLQSIEKIANHLKISKIVLNSVKSAIPFYEKYGFKKTKMCEENNLCEMKKMVTKTNIYATSTTNPTTTTTKKNVAQITSKSKNKTRSKSRSKTRSKGKPRSH